LHLWALTVSDRINPCVDSDAHYFLPLTADLSTSSKLLLHGSHCPRVATNLMLVSVLILRNKLTNSKLGRSCWPKTVPRILEGHAEGCSTAGKLGGERIRSFYVGERIPFPCESRSKLTTPLARHIMSPQT
jgi:hypothetical protein